MQREAKAKHGDKGCDDMFDDLHAKIREYAQQRRLEELTRMSKGDAMDIGQLQNKPDDWHSQDNLGASVE